MYNSLYRLGRALSMIPRVLATLLLFLFNSVGASYTVEQLTTPFSTAFCTYSQSMLPNQSIANATQPGL